EALLGDVARESSYATPYGPMFTWPRRIPPELVPPDVAEILKRAVVDEPRTRFADAAQFRRAVVTALARHAPGYDAETLANDLARLNGGSLDYGTPDLDENTDVATELRADRPRLSLVATPVPPGLARPATLTATATPSGAVATLPVGAATLPLGAASTVTGS